jgi:hypothetical protein
MKRIRFNIAGLLGIILVLGVGFAALREASDLWESGVFTLTLGAMLTSILLAIHQAEKRRAFWIGFALFGSAYLGFALVPSIESRLITTKALTYVRSSVSRRSLKITTVALSATWRLAPGIGSGPSSNEVQSVVSTTDGNQIATSSQGQVKIWDAMTGKLLGGWSGTTGRFVKIGHSLFALLAGWRGGQLSRRLFQSSRFLVPSTLVNAELTNS